MPANWGSVARRGAHLVRSQSPKAKDAPPIPSGPVAPQDEWVRVDADARPIAKTTERPRHRTAVEVPGDVAAAIRRSAATATAYQRERLVEQMGSAAEAYARNRFEEASRFAARLASEVPDVAEVQELAGLSSYRMERWRQAAKHLEAYRSLSGEAQYIPLEMDAQRGLGKVRSIPQLFEILRQESPDPDTLAEGRLVLAGSLADRGKLGEAIELLESNGAGKPRKNPNDRHIRQWYVLGDLYDRSGNAPRAREFFSLVNAAAPDAYDVRARLQELGPRRRPRKSPKKSIKK
jgi:tetratricopeptide (TPR) repeat protein